MMIRDKLLSKLLEIYIGGGQQGFETNTSSCYVNQYVDDVVEALLLKSEIRFLSKSVIPLLRVE